MARETWSGTWNRSARAASIAATSRPARDALARTSYGAPDAIVTNPPFDTDNDRKLMHRLIRHFLRSGTVAWLLIDSDWMFTQQATPFLPACSDVVTIGRVKWFGGTPDQSTDNFAWYFDFRRRPRRRAAAALEGQGGGVRRCWSLPGRGGAAMSERHPLPSRRRAETFTVIHWNQPFTVTIGFYDDGQPAEVFVDAAKTGNDIAHIARDAAIVVSIALQCGASTATLKHAMTRDSRGAPASILGAVIDALPATLRGAE